MASTGGAKAPKSGAFTGGTAAPGGKKPRKPRKAKGKPQGTVKGPKGVKARRRKPYDPLQPLTGRGLRQEVKRGTRLRYAPEQAQLGVERRISNQQLVNIPHYYDQYKQLLAEMDAKTAQGYQQAQAGVYNQANLAAGQDEQQRQQLATESQRSASLRGTSAAPDVAGQQASQARRALSSSFGGLVGQHGAAQGAYGASRQAAAGAGKLRALQDETGRRRTLEESGRKLAREKGDYAVGYRRQLIDSEHKKRLENAAFNLNTFKAQEDVRSNKARERENRKNRRAVVRDKTLDNMREDAKFRLDREEFGFDKAKDRYQRRHGLGPYKPSSDGGSDDKSGTRASPAKAQANQDKFSNAVGKVQTYKKKGYQWNYQAALNAGLPADLAKAAALRGIGKLPSKKLADAIFRRHGVRMKFGQSRQVGGHGSGGSPNA